MGRYIGLIALGVVLMSTAVFAEIPGSIGVITSVEGVADISRSGQDAVFLRENDPVFLNDRIRTKNFSKITITFLDHSVVKMAPGTCLTIDTYQVDQDRKRELAMLNMTRGKVEAVVSKTSRPESFVITTPNATGKVKGSDIFMFYEAGKTGALVKEGLMTLASQAVPDKSVNITAGDVTLVSFNKEPMPSRTYLDAELNRCIKDVEPAFTRKKIVYEGISPVTAAVSNARGEVRIYKKGADDWRPVKVHEIFQEGDKLQTGANGTAEIRSGNGNIIILLANAELEAVTLAFDEKNGTYENTYKAEMGKIKAVVEKLGTNSKFQIKTPTAICGVRGTVMYLDIQPNSTQAFYEGGNGYMMSAATSQVQELAAGQNAACDMGGIISTPLYTSTDQHMSLEQNFTAPQMPAQYSSPTEVQDIGVEGGITSNTSQTAFQAVTATDNTPLAVQTETTSNLVPFDHTSNDAQAIAATNVLQPGGSVAETTYTTNLNQSTLAAQPISGMGSYTPGVANMSVNITVDYTNNTWQGSLVSGEQINGPIAASTWTLTLTNASGDSVSFTSSDSLYPAGGQTSFSGTINQANSTVDGHRLTGSVSGNVYGVGNDGGTSGEFQNIDMSGTIVSTVDHQISTPL